MIFFWTYKNMIFFWTYKNMIFFQLCSTEQVAPPSGQSIEYM